MSEKRTIDDAQVRVTAAQVEIDLEAIAFYAENLREKIEVLDRELPFADPSKDKAFEKFLYTLLRLVTQLQYLGDLKEMARAMQEFHLPHAAEVREIMRQMKSEKIQNRQSQIENIGRELVHA